MISLLLGLALNANAQDAETFDAPSADDLEFAPELLPDFFPDETDRVVGGDPVEEGEWNDTVGIVFNQSYVGCTGTLIAPDIVVTAGHCVGGISHVLIGAHTDRKRDGEVIEVSNVYEYPNSQRNYDAAALVLAKPSTYEHRIVGADCIADDYLVDGAEVAVVGYGATRENGGGNTDKKQVGYTYIQDHDGDSNKIEGFSTGFNGSVSPGGELGAGGNDVDACFGDSGGPLYLLTERGDYLVGITSRGYSGVPYNKPCKYGGIYVRPDAILDWIEKKTDRTIDRPVCNFAPEPTAELLVAKKNEWGTTQIDPNDPDAFNTHEYVVVEDPAHGTVEVGSDGFVVYTPEQGYVGSDAFTVEVWDDGSDYEASPPEYAELTIDVDVTRSGRPSDGEGFGAGCGCSSGSGLAGLWALPVALLALRRRR